MNTAERPAEAVQRARRGVLMSQALAEARTGQSVDLDGGQRLQILDTLIASIGGLTPTFPQSERHTRVIRCRL